MSIVKLILKSYRDKDAVNDVMHYCLKSNGDCSEWGGHGVCTISLQTAIDGFKQIKKFYKKEDGKQLHHFVVSISRTMYTENKSEYLSKKRTENISTRLIAYELSEQVFNEGYQNCWFIHTDTSYCHIHLLINSVNYKTGKKLNNLFNFKKIIETYLKCNYSYLQWE